MRALRWSPLALFWLSSAGCALISDDDLAALLAGAADGSGETGRPASDTATGGDDTGGLGDDTGSNSNNGSGDDTSSGSGDDTSGSGGDDTTSPDDDTGPCVLPRLQGVEVPYGSTGGGQEVSLTGEQLEDVTRVTFDGVEASLISVGSEEILAITPEVAYEGRVDVVVEAPCGDSELERGFFYFEDAAGLGGNWGYVEWVDYIGGYWISSMVDFGRAWWRLSSPNDLHYWDGYAPGDDVCESNYGLPIKTGVYDLTISTTEITIAGASSFTAGWDSSTLLWAGTFGEPAWEFNADIEMAPISGSELDGMTIEPLGVTPSELVIDSPNLYGALPPTLSESELSFTWTSPDADRIVIQLGYAADAWTISEIVSCVALNDGAFTVPTGTFTSTFQGNGDVLFVLFSAAREGGGTVPINGGESRIAGVHSAYGVIQLSAN